MPQTESSYAKTQGQYFE